jgi:CDGSH-type Zn-finger protein
MPRIVEIKDQTPLLIRPEDTVNGIVAVCRCGLSGNWPFCNGTHKATIGEDPDKLYHYDRELPQGTPRRHEIDLGDLEQRSRKESQKQEDPPAGGQQADDGGHGAGATPVRPPRPEPQHENARGVRGPQREAPAERREA